MRITNLKLKKGFTLIEILVVISIIGTLAGLTTFSLQSGRNKGNDTRRKADLKAIQTATISYYQDHSQFPPDPASSPGNVYSSDIDPGTGWIPGISAYITKLPKDPLQSGILYFLAGTFKNNIRNGEHLMARLFSKPPPQHVTKVIPQVAGATSVTINANLTDGWLQYSNTAYPPDPSGSCSANTGSTQLSVGQFINAGTYYKRRAYLAFNTSSIPAGSTINSVTLTQNLISKSNVLTNFNLLALNYNWSNTLTCSQWGGSPPSATQVGSIATTSLPANGSNFNMTLSNSVVTMGGTTYIMLVSDRDIIKIPPSQNEYLYLGSAETPVNPSQIIVNYTPPTDNATFISQTAPPASMTAGQTAIVTVTMQNSGTTTWVAGSGAGPNVYKLGTQNPQDNTTWTGSNRVLLASNVAPGSTYAFTFTITAPSTAGTYNFQWQMVNEGVAWFGGLSTNVVVTVAAGPPIGSISASPPSIPSGQSSTIIWGSVGATSCIVTPTGWTGISGSQSTGVLTSSQTYTLNCSGPGGNSIPVTATVTIASTAPTATIKANGSSGPVTVNAGDAVGITWTSSNSSSCTVSGGPGGSGTSGSFVWTATTTTTFSISCSGPGGTGAGSVVVNVNTVDITTCQNKNNIYCYIVNTDRSSFVIWAQLENPTDPGVYNQPNATCKLTPPASTFFNYCVQSSSL